MEHLISKEYKEIITAHHANKVWGGAVNNKIPKIHKFMLLSNSKSILDYGAGQSAFKNGLPVFNIDYKYKIHEYEPGIPGLDEDPPVCDATICFDVLEHIEPDKIDNVLQHIYDKTNNWFLADICCVPAMSCFTVKGNKENLHPLVRKPEWWIKKFTNEKWNILELTSNHRYVNILLKKEKI
jgi:hypothetical protein